MGAPETRAGHRGNAGEVVLAGRGGVRYRVHAKRSLPKLAVRREIIRALSILELAYAVGGGTALVEDTQTCKENCTSRVLVKAPAVG
jgi:hypothetical protein